MFVLVVIFFCVFTGRSGWGLWAFFFLLLFLNEDSFLSWVVRALLRRQPGGLSASSIDAQNIPVASFAKLSPYISNKATC